MLADIVCFPRLDWEGEGRSEGGAVEATGFQSDGAFPERFSFHRTFDDDGHALGHAWEGKRSRVREFARTEPIERSPFPTLVATPRSLTVVPL